MVQAPSTVRGEVRYLHCSVGHVARQPVENHISCAGYFAHKITKTSEIGKCKAGYIQLAGIDLQLGKPVFRL